MMMQKIDNEHALDKMETNDTCPMVKHACMSIKLILLANKPYWFCYNIDEICVGDVYLFGNIVRIRYILDFNWTRKQKTLVLGEYTKQ